MPYLNKVFSSLSIKLLVISLAVISTLACIVLGGTALFTNQQQSKGQSNLTQISDIQTSSAKVIELIVNSQNFQVEVVAADTPQAIDALGDRSSISSEYEQASEDLKRLTKDDSSMSKLLSNLDNNFQSFSDIDAAIYDKSKEIIGYEMSSSVLAAKIDTQLNTIDSLIGGISGKISYTEKKNKRAIKRIVKKIDPSSTSYDPETIKPLVDSVSSILVGEEARLIESVNSIKFDLLSLSAIARQLLSSFDIDTVISLKKNRVDQHIESMRGLLGSLNGAFSDNTELQDLSNELNKALEVYVQTAFLRESSIYQLQLNIINSTKQRKDLIAKAFEQAIALNNTLESLSTGVMDARQSITVNSQESATNSKWLVLIMTAIVIVILIILSIFIITAINQPLRRVSKALHEIAMGDGDLTQRLDARGVKEVAQISLEFNRFVEKIAVTISQVNEASTNLSASSDVLSDVSKRTKEDIQVQQGETSRAALAIAEMSEAASSVAENAEQARQSSQEVLAESESGNETLEQVVLAIEKLATVIANASDSINELDKFSVSIGAVLDVIRGIAEQTNLLALNAAIEAARAGEQGRGFAVVADEVRSLASRTQESTIEIETMIQQLQSGAQNAVQVIEKGNEEVTRTEEQVALATSSLTKITQAIIEITSMNDSIASAAEEQSMVTQTIGTNVVAINQIGDRTVKGTDDITRSGEDLSKLSSELESLMRHFKT